MSDNKKPDKKKSPYKKRFEWNPNDVIVVKKPKKDEKKPK